MTIETHARRRDTLRLALGASAACCLLLPAAVTAQEFERITDPDILAYIDSLDEHGIPPGYKVVEGDIIVPDDQTIAGTYAPDLWPNGRVYFVCDDNVTIPNRQAMRAAMAEWEAVANVQFIYLNDYHPHHILIRDSDQNNSHVGMSGAPSQVINIFNWNIRFIMVHELGHALGLWHEQSRRDRAEYITVHWSRIQADYDHNFDTEFYSDVYGPYDFDSVMHYGQCSFSTCGTNCTEDPVNCCQNNLATCRTIEVLPPCDTTCQAHIGQRDHLSYLDRITMSFLYPEDDWVFVDRTSSPLGAGTFDWPYTAFTFGEAYVPTGGIVWINPGKYYAIDTFARAMTFRAPLGGVLLSNGDGLGPSVPDTCCP